VVAGLAVVCWWTGTEDGVRWDPASGPPTEPLRELADLAALRDTWL
jgi:hypothetical protein